VRIDYTGFSSADLICDEYFQNWIIQPDKETNDFWNNWLLQHPEKSETVEEARSFLLNIEFKEHFPSEEQAQNSLASTLSILRIGERQPVKKPAIRISIPGLKKIIKIAAIFIILASAGSVFYYTYWAAKNTIYTKYGETKNVLLPDGSLVILNAHSTISYSRHKRKGLRMQIWLDGEAFFDIKHGSEPFIVSTYDLNINVLGTSFDVKKRAYGTEAILKTGKIVIEFKNGHYSPVTMLPGQMVAYENRHHPVLRSVEPAMYTTWIDKKLILRESSVNEIAQYIQDYFGYKVIMEDTTIGSRKMEGVLLLDDLKDLLFVLSNTLNIEIEKQENTLLFKSRK